MRYVRTVDYVNYNLQSDYIFPVGQHFDCIDDIEIMWLRLCYSSGSHVVRLCYRRGSHVVRLCYRSGSHVVRLCYRSGSHVVDYALTVPATHRSSMGDRAFPVAASRPWNALPAHIRSSSSLLTFRRELKPWLFQSSFN